MDVEIRLGQVSPGGRRGQVCFVGRPGGLQILVAVELDMKLGRLRGRRLAGELWNLWDETWQDVADISGVVPVSRLFDALWILDLQSSAPSAGYLPFPRRPP